MLYQIAKFQLLAHSPFKVFDFQNHIGKFWSVLDGLTKFAVEKLYFAVIYHKRIGVWQLQLTVIAHTINNK